ncbi:MAG TPA: alpha-E domain-containing protein [Candidatus Blautia pullicola]|jgi:uncharacterized alpha-E superfamily protein|uniref:Alpha-E domain-containing protein n=1 Tax=Candidatus Blautia pullicola TaxID=2838498 RepID=A0A9D2JSV6_9FIRM|nr:alpha-E domain-containing protein [Candidatus Blautia pullicola]
MGIISIENTDHLYWLGRYIERVGTTIELFAENYDYTLDSGIGRYDEFCQKLDIPNIYTSREHFIKEYCFGSEDPNSIWSNLMRAYDNAVVLREEISSEALSYIQLAVYALNKARESTSPMIELQEVVDNLLAFWGLTDDCIDDENTRNIIKIGKRVERLDLYARLHMPRTEMLRAVHRLAGRIVRTNLSYNTSRLAELHTLAEAEDIDYRKIVTAVENLLEE